MKNPMSELERKLEEIGDCKVGRMMRTELPAGMNARQFAALLNQKYQHLHFSGEDHAEVNGISTANIYCATKL